MPVKHTIREKAGKTTTTQRPDSPRCVSVVVLVGILSSVSMCLCLLDPFFFFCSFLSVRVCVVFALILFFFYSSSPPPLSSCPKPSSALFPLHDDAASAFLFFFFICHCFFFFKHAEHRTPANLQCASVHVRMCVIAYVCSRTVLISFKTSNRNTVHTSVFLLFFFVCVCAKISPLLFPFYSQQYHPSKTLRQHSGASRVFF